jgi:hypothetical protein
MKANQMNLYTHIRPATSSPSGGWARKAYKYLASLIIALCFLLHPSSCILAQGADTVISVRWGTGQDFGRGRFPANILGLPDTTARKDIPSNNPAQVCSLGMGGEIVLGWKNAVLVNRTGADFTIFENVFLNFNGRAFAEPAKIAVSQDGVRFVEFPFDSLSLRGCAGVTPTNGNQNPLNPALSGGDSFDLATIGMDSIRFVKITDISAMVLNNPRHPFYDPTITGFDVDALVGISLVRTSGRTSVQQSNFAKIAVIIQSDFCTIELAEVSNSAVFDLYTVQGSSILHSQVNTRISFLTSHLPRGAYFLVIKENGNVTTKPILLN